MNLLRLRLQIPIPRQKVFQCNKLNLKKSKFLMIKNKWVER